MTDALPSLELALTPHGVLTARMDDNAPAWARAIAARFAEGEGAGIARIRRAWPDCSGCMMAELHREVAQEADQGADIQGDKPRGDS